MSHIGSKTAEKAVMTGPRSNDPGNGKPVPRYGPGSDFKGKETNTPG